MKRLPLLHMPRSVNYAAFFLTFMCNLRCDYCINAHAGSPRPLWKGKKTLTPEELVAAADRLSLRPDLPLTLQGGEPTLSKAFFTLVNDAKRSLKMDLLTNLMFDPHQFIANVPVWRFTRAAPYASIRVSYHPGQNRIEELVKKTRLLTKAGFRVGIYGILHPDATFRKHILEVQKECLKQGIDFRTKEFLGAHKGKLYGRYKYKGSIRGKTMRTCQCRTSELIVDPAGYVYRCHADLYAMRQPIGHILDRDLTPAGVFKYRRCDYFGDCNPCDVKVKTNRLQVFGHTSVTIRGIKERG